MVFSSKNFNTAIYQKILLICVCIIGLVFVSFNATASLITSSPSVFINEFHYDNAGQDKEEFIELIGQSGTDLSLWKIALYNGSDGSVYHTINLSGSLSHQSSGFGFAVFSYQGIQNGAADGFALIDGSGLVQQFISYEGSIIASNGAAIGMTSQDIGISESSSTPVGYSLQLSGTGNQLSDFTWIHAQETEGLANYQQSLLPLTKVPEPSSVIILLLGLGILMSMPKKINWFKHKSKLKLKLIPKQN